MRENLKDVKPLQFGPNDGQDVIKPFENALKETGHLTILKGNLCPGSAVAKLTGKEGLHFEVRSDSHLPSQELLTHRAAYQGTAKCFDMYIMTTVGTYIWTTNARMQGGRFLPRTSARRDYSWHCCDIPIPRAKRSPWNA
jgi:hypothetical protein